MCILVCGMINITFFVIDGLVDWQNCLIVKIVVFRFYCSANQSVNIVSSDQCVNISHVFNSQNKDSSLVGRIGNLV